MMEIACQCEEAYGLPHTHVAPQVLIERRGQLVWLPQDIWELNEFSQEGLLLVSTQPAGVRVWIDWKKVAREVMVNGNPGSSM